MDGLPTELLHNIYQYLDGPSLVNLTKVNNHMRSTVLCNQSLMNKLGYIDLRELGELGEVNKYVDVVYVRTMETLREKLGSKYAMHLRYLGTKGDIVELAYFLNDYGNNSTDRIRIVECYSGGTT
jgi:hypothetical protein